MDIKHINDIDYYTGEFAIEGIKFRSAATALGVTAWGMNVLEFEPNTSGHPVHNHEEDGQEEIYFIVSGAIDLVVGDTATTLSAGTMVRVPPETTRQLVTRESGAVVLAIGAAPGKAHVPSGM